jgi:hypothetical protein
MPADPKHTTLVPVRTSAMTAAVQPAASSGKSRPDHVKIRPWESQRPRRSVLVSPRASTSISDGG